MIYQQDSELASFPSGDFTVIVKFNLESYDRTKTIFSWRLEGSVDPMVGLYMDISQEGKIEAGFGDGLGGKSKVRSNYVPRLGYPCIAVWTSKGQDMELWVDGRYAGLGQRFDDPIDGNKLQLGTDSYFPTSDFNGEIYSVEIMEGVLSSEEIRLLEI